VLHREVVRLPLGLESGARPVAAVHDQVPEFVGGVEASALDGLIVFKKTNGVLPRQTANASTSA
jgi:hypothetical protein